VAIHLRHPGHEAAEEDWPERARAADGPSLEPGHPPKKRAVKQKEKPVRSQPRSSTSRRPAREGVIKGALSKTVWIVCNKVRRLDTTDPRPFTPARPIPMQEFSLLNQSSKKATSISRKQWLDHIRGIFKTSIPLKAIFNPQTRQTIGTPGVELTYDFSNDYRLVLE
jgi:hypothetical protein